MRVLHFFDQFLPTTMNWAWRLLHHTPQTEPHIAAFIQHECSFRSSDFGYVVPWYQPVLPRNEGAINTLHRAVSWADRHYIGGYVRQVERYIRDQNIAVCHAHFGHLGVHWSPVTRRLGLPLVVSFYGFDVEMLPRTRPHFRAKYQKLFDEADLFLCEGRHGIEALKKLGCPPEKLVIQHFGVDVNHVVAQHRHKKVNQLRLVQVASFTEKKGHQYTLEAFRLALADCPNIHLTLIGSATQPNVLRWVYEFVEKHQLQANVVVKMAMPFGELYDTLGQFDVLIQPSHAAQNGDSEGGPVILLDAQATGLPVISSTHANIPDIAPHEHSSILAAERDASGIANAIRRFYQMQDVEYQQFSSQARKHIEAEYNLETTCSQLEKRYRSLV